MGLVTPLHDPPFWLMPMKTQIELFNYPVLNDTDCINGLTNLNMTNPYQHHINVWLTMLI